MKFRRPKINNPFQFFSLILIVAIATVWIGLLAHFAWKQMQPKVALDPTPTPLAQTSPAPNSNPANPSNPTIPSPISPSPIPASPIPAIPVSPDPAAPVTVSPVEPDNPQPTNVSPPVLPLNVETKYNHLPYQLATSNLVEVGVYYDRSEWMVSEAANAFWRMKDAAAASGVNIGPISGYRTVDEQAELFERQVQRHNGSPEAAARLSAPEGHSEHHTGYTIDIRDLDQTDTDLKYAMEETKAYRWLVQNACEYGFELSFPDGNQQGVSFEPWHWRFVGSPTAKKIFSPARELFPYPTNCP